MLFAVSVPPFGQFGDVRRLAQLAADAEKAGWDAFFIWDHIFFDPTFHPMPDTWVALAAIALSTQKIRIGALVTPIPRRRPWKLARETVSVDGLSNGRLIFGAGLGDPVQWDFGFFGDEQDARIRAARLDEGLAVLEGLWSGEMFQYEGEQYQVKPVRFLPKPVQQPRIPIWIGGGWDKRKPQQRAARYDGFIPLKWGDKLTLDDWRGIQQTVLQHRTSEVPFVWVHSGTTDGDKPDQAAQIVRPFADFGLTWWLEAVDPWRWGLSWEEPIPPHLIDKMEERIRQGPPRL
jgi:alkanesulfonate monooxygenase SsuD/methylene tetrahydromethanopterin reductase-like flavin-dependent oxidoreductase (luciferase family)